MKPPDAQFAWRGWILAVLFLGLAAARWLSADSVQPLGLLPILAGAGYRLYAGRYIQAHSNSRRMAGDVLAFHGPYRYGRHPLYLSNLVVIAGLIVYANCLPWWGGALLFAAAWIHHGILARSEERYLAAAWGEAYLGYLRVTPRWFGRPGRIGGSPGAAPPVSGALPSSRAAGLAVAAARQGGNLGKTAACVILLRVLAAA